MTRILALTALLVLLAQVARAELLKREPAMGMLKPGQLVHVDDGRCPTGQVMAVTGGDHVKVGGRGLVERQRRCVPRPPG